MIKKELRLTCWAIGFGLALAACAPSSQFVVRDADLAKKAKKVAIIPFLMTNARSPDFPDAERYPKLTKWSMTYKFMTQAEAQLSGRYQFIPARQVLDELQKRGFIEGFDPEKSVWSQMGVQLPGCTVPQALEVGKKLGADTVLLGAVSMGQTRPPFAISVRMLDVKSGKVIVAASSQSGGGLSFSPWNAPIEKVVSRLAKEAP